MQAWRGPNPNGERSRGQAMVEFMLIVPLVLLILFAIIEIARVMHAWLAVVNGARFGVRYATTNTYDPLHCPGGNCSTEAEELDARIESIEQAAILGSTSILRDLDETNWDVPGYFKVTICSESATSYTESRPAEFDSDWTAVCSPGQEPGDEGDLVWVTVDFNHPLIAPILSADWPMLHLTSRRDGVVESFRTVRFVGAGPFTPAPTHTPTITPTPSLTPTPSMTPTPSETITPSPTPCFSLPIVEIIDPLDGSVYNDGDDLTIQATAYDPDNVNPDTCTGVAPDGTGITRVEFLVYWYNGSSWQWMHSQTESVVGYCGFGGNGPCNSLTIGSENWPSGQLVRSGQHVVLARARDDEGDYSGYDYVFFTIHAPPTPTPTFTATPSCEDVRFGNFYFDRWAFIRQRVVNNSYPGLQVTGVTVYWGPLEEGSDLYGWNEYIDWIEWDGTRIRNSNDSTSPTAANRNLPRGADVGTHTIRVDWDGAFNGHLNDPPANLSADNFGFSVQFSDPACNLSRMPNDVIWPTPTMTATASNTPPPSSTPLPTNTPTPSDTPTVTPTPSITPTPSKTVTPSRTPTETYTPPPSNTPPPTFTPVPTETEALTTTPTPTHTATPTWTPLPDG